MLRHQRHWITLQSWHPRIFARLTSPARGAPNADLERLRRQQPATPDPTRSTSVIAFATSDFPSVLQGFLHTEQQYLTPASQNAHNIRIFLAPAHSKRVHNRRSRVRADRVARESRSYAPGRN